MGKYLTLAFITFLPLQAFCSVYDDASALASVIQTDTKPKEHFFLQRSLYVNDSIKELESKGWKIKEIRPMKDYDYLIIYE